MRNPVNFGENSPNFFFHTKGSKSTNDIVCFTGECECELKTDVNWHEYLMTILSTSIHLLILIVVIQIISNLIPASCLLKIS